jgi:hypothetical protein
MFTCASIARSRDRRRDACTFRIDLAEIHLPSGCPRPEHVRSARCDRHARHRTSADLPGLHFRAAERLSVLPGLEHVDVAVRECCRRTVKQVQRARRAGKHPKTAAAASARSRQFALRRTSPHRHRIARSRHVVGPRRSRRRQESRVTQRTRGLPHLPRLNRRRRWRSSVLSDPAAARTPFRLRCIVSTGTAPPPCHSPD